MRIDLYDNQKSIFYVIIRTRHLLVLKVNTHPELYGLGMSATFMSATLLFPLLYVSALETVGGYFIAGDTSCKFTLELALFETGMVLFENWTCLFAGPNIGLGKEILNSRAKEGLGVRQGHSMLENILIPRVACCLSQCSLGHG